VSNRSVIVGTGSYLPTKTVRNRDFLDHQFFAPDGTRYSRTNAEIIEKFEEITGIGERRYVTDDLVTSDIAALAAEDALESSGTDPDSLDHLIVAHNFGDVSAGNRRSDLVPSLASRVKQRLGIRSSRAVCYDIPFGCPGWLQALIQADSFLKAGAGRKALVIGAEVLSRVSDPHDRDSMIYADGAGAAILESVPADPAAGVLSHAAWSDAMEHAQLLRMGRSYNPEYDDGPLFLKMSGHRLYEYALRTVPQVIADALARAGVMLADVSKVLIHQANAKMDEAIVRRLCRLCGVEMVDESVVPMTISWLGNSSVATLPTLLDLILKGRLPGHSMSAGDLIVFASVGAGMNANAMVYRMS
jgi:3-oxoacyl-[acyl-carrier-protein] synthase-3